MIHGVSVGEGLCRCWGERGAEPTTGTPGKGKMNPHNIWFWKPEGPNNQWSLTPETKKSDWTLWEPRRWSPQPKRQPTEISIEVSVGKTHGGIQNIYLLIRVCAGRTGIFKGIPQDQNIWLHNFPPLLPSLEMWTPVGTAQHKHST